MTSGKAKTASKIFISNPTVIKHKVLTTLNKISAIVGSTMGPHGRNCLIESDFNEIPSKSTKDGVSVFRSLGSKDPFEHLIIEHSRDAANRTATEAGDGTTSATVLAAAMTTYLYQVCEDNPRLSPQRVARDVSKVVRNDLVPYIKEKATKIVFGENDSLLYQVAKISANGDDDIAEAVLKAFDLIGYSNSSHVTIKELSGPYGYEVSVVEGYPISIGLEESTGKLQNAFINDVTNQRCYVEKPLYLLIDGQLSDLMSVHRILEAVGETYANGSVDHKNIVIFAHSFSESVLTNLAFNFANPETINVVPIMTPKAGFLNAQTHFLYDLAAFTNAKVFGLKDSVAKAQIKDLGTSTSFESSRFRSTIVGDPDVTNIEVRVEQLQTQRKNPESVAESMWLDERIGKLTSGIAKITVYGGSSGELKEMVDRVEDAVLSVRSAITRGVLEGGCRTLIDLTIMVQKGDHPIHVKQVLIPSLMTPIQKILENAGYNDGESGDIVSKLIENPNQVYDVSEGKFGTALELGLFDSTAAVEEALKNALSVAVVMGTCGGVVCYPRDPNKDYDEFEEEKHIKDSIENVAFQKNEANERI